MKKRNVGLIVAFLLFLFSFAPGKVFALETGFLPPTTCSTDGSSCSAMLVQDTSFNSWVGKSSENVSVKLTGFGIPDDAIIDDIQIKMRIKTSSSGWSWFVNASTDNGTTFFSPRNCSFHGVCQFNTAPQFNPISPTYPTMSWLNNNPSKILLGKDINSDTFVLKLFENGAAKNTDIDLLLFNVRYHTGSIGPLVNAYQMTNGFMVGPPAVAGVGQVFYFWNFSVPYTGGKVVLSSNPQGTGNLEFADSLILVNSSFNSATFTYNSAPQCILKHAIPPIDITAFFSSNPQGLNTGSIKLIDLCGTNKTIQPIYVVVFPAPFLDLPWDYEGKGMTFSEAALKMKSYFDHEYPLLSGGLKDQIGDSTLKKYDGSPSTDQLPYPYHDGYDYARGAKVYIGDPVLAAAAGVARYVNSCGACGNMIVIDHENGYQTRYLHMQKDGLIVSTPSASVRVSMHQEIGKVGATGNVFPAGDAGAHIHFGVFQDKNHDGNFDDNVPDGVTDPFGWQGKDPDPWEIYAFTYGGKQRTGNKSYYLWKKSLGEKEESLTSTGGTFSSGTYHILFPNGAVLQPVILHFTPEPITTASGSLATLGTVLALSATDTSGNDVHTFAKDFTLSSDFSNIDLTRYDVSTISFYSSTDGIHWNKEITQVDLAQKTASTSLSHFTHFALMAERSDTIAPVTSLVLNGSVALDTWYKAPLIATLSATDNPGGLGVDYTVYKTEQEDWGTYSQPLSFTTEGLHEISFYSADKDENIEEQKTVQFRLDNTPPVLIASLSAGQDIYSPGTWTNKDVRVAFSCSDTLSGVASVSAPVVIYQEGENQQVSGYCVDTAGNKTNITVEHINIDKTPPKIALFASPKFLWPPNGKMVPVKIKGTILEQNLSAKSFKVIDEYHTVEPVLSDFGTIKLEAKRRASDFDGRVYIIKVEAVDKAGNKSTSETKVIVPHDERKEEKEHHEKEK